MLSPIQIKFTEDSWDILNCLLKKEEGLKGFQKLVTKQNNQRSLPLNDALKIVKWKCFDQNHISVNQLLKNAEILLPKPQDEPRSKELEERLKKLQVEQEKYEYNKMVENLYSKNPTHKHTMRVPMVSGLNFAVTVLACIFGATFALRNIVPDLLLRCAIGFAVGIVLMCIEIFLSVRAIMKQEKEEAKCKKGL